MTESVAILFHFRHFCLLIILHSDFPRVITIIIVILIPARNIIWTNALELPPIIIIFFVVLFLQHVSFNIGDAMSFLLTSYCNTYFFFYIIVYTRRNNYSMINIGITFSSDKVKKKCLPTQSTKVSMCKPERHVYNYHCLVKT